MKTKQILTLMLLLIVTAQAACSPSADACPSPAAGTKLLKNSEDGYCLLYPEEYSTAIPNHIVINPIDAPGDMPGDAWAFVVVEDAAGRTAAQVADAEIAAAGAGFNITRTEVKVDNEGAVVVDGLPGPDPWRRVFVVHENRLYTLVFMPWQSNEAAGQITPLEGLYGMVIQSLRFIPPTKALPTATPA